MTLNLITDAVRHFQKKTFEEHCKDGREELYLDKVTEVKGLKYDKSRKYQSLDVVSPKGKENEKLPVIIDMHGGGYVSCWNGINMWQSRYFATQGIRVVNINYRLMPEVGFVEAMQDLFSVFKWMSNNADTYHFDLDNVLLTGDSAGGHMVLLAYFILNSEELKEAYQVTYPAFKLKIVADCPAGGIGAFTTKPKTTRENPFYSAISDRLRKKIVSQPANDIHYDIQHYQASTPLMIITTPDDAVLYKETLAIHQEMAEKGLKHTYKEYLGASHKLEHVFPVTWPEWEESQKANNDIIAFLMQA